MERRNFPFQGLDFMMAALVSAEPEEMRQTEAAILILQIILKPESYIDLPPQFEDGKGECDSGCICIQQARKGEILHRYFLTWLSLPSHLLLDLTLSFITLPLLIPSAALCLLSSSPIIPHLTAGCPWEFLSSSSFSLCLATSSVPVSAASSRTSFSVWVAGAIVSRFR